MLTACSTAAPSPMLTVNGAIRFQRLSATGQHSITITTTDFGGDTSAESEALTITVDTTAPDAGSMLGLPLGGSTTDDPYFRR